VREMPGAPGSVTGGTTPPNGETYELMYFEHTGVNPFVATEEDALSTFAVDVDNASYTLTRNYLQRGVLPPKDAIRVEEFVNFFGGDYPDQTEDVFAIHTDGSPSRFGPGYQLLRVGLKGMTVAAENRKPANLIFVIDVSGSMGRENRLGLVKQSLGVLLDELREGDRVGIVVYGSQGRILLEPTGIEQRESIQAAIDALQTSGATNACEGLEMAYDLARRHYDAGIINRIILCSDGVANMGGTTRAEEMLKVVRQSTDQGITLSTVGFGMGNYNDVLMEKLADQGDGNYHYVDKLPEAERVFRANLTGLLQTIARQVKIQVEFNPDRVQRWRLLGYENRDVADRDFRNDAVDAGEVGAGHEVTALYELKVTDGQGDLGTVRVRYEFPAHDTARAGQVKEIQHAIKSADLADEFVQARLELRLQAVAAEFAEILRGSFWAKESLLKDLVPVADGLAHDMEGNEKAAELADMIRRAAQLKAAEEGPARD
jgi:Ca-activated chloride channel family protein